MVYVDQQGRICTRRSIWRLSIIPEFFMGVVNFIILFFATMFQPSRTRYGSSGYTTDYRPGPGSQGGPRRRMGGFGPNNSPAPPPMAGGG